MMSNLDKLATNSREVMGYILEKNNYPESLYNALMTYFFTDSNINKTFSYLNGNELKIFYPIEHFEDLESFIANDNKNNLYFVIKVDASRSELLLEYGFNTLDFPFLISKIDIDIIKEINNSQSEECNIKDKKFIKEWQLFNKYSEWYILKRTGIVNKNDDYSDPVCFRDSYTDEFINISSDDKDKLFTDSMKRYFHCEFNSLHYSFKTEVFKEACIKRYDDYNQ